MAKVESIDQSKGKIELNFFERLRDSGKVCSAQGKIPDGRHVLKLRFFGKISRLRRSAILEFSAMKLLPYYSVF